MLSIDLDQIDKKILELIQNDASLSVAEIAEKVGLSSSPCWRRIKRMEEQGVIQRRVTVLDRSALGLNFEVVASVKLGLPTRDNLEQFEAAVEGWPEVVECMTVT
jgi:Lrp/AsnC family transcriptional regulator